MLSRRLIRIKVIKSLYAHFSSGESSLVKSEKEYQHNLNECYKLYIFLLTLIVEIADYAETRAEIGRIKMLATEEDKNPNYKFIHNSIIAMLRDDEELAKLTAKYRLSWAFNPLIIKALYEEMIEAPYYKAYMNSAKQDFLQDRKMAMGFYLHHIEENEEFEKAIEELSIFWSDDINFALTHVISTIGRIQNEDDNIEIEPIFNNDSDKEYAQMLYRKALVNNAEYFQYVDKLTDNWDFERIAYMDRLIMLTAITELIHFPTIPVKVTLDEFIEISKYYSTSGSSTFVNGIIDKAINTLTEEGKINKTGRGLIEN